MADQLQSAVPINQQPPGATGMSEGPDGKMYFHDIAGKQLGLAPENIQQAESAQKPLFDMSKAEPIAVSAAPAVTKPLFDMSKAEPIQGAAPVIEAAPSLEGLSREELIKAQANIPAQPRSIIGAAKQSGWFQENVIAPVADQVKRIRDSVLENEGPGWLPYDIAEHFRPAMPPPPTATDEEAQKNLLARNSAVNPQEIESEKYQINKRRVDTQYEQRNAKQYAEGGTRLLSPEKLMTPEEKQNYPVLYGLLHFAGSLTTQENMEIMGGSAGLGFLGEAAAIAPQLGVVAKVVAATPRIVSLYFAGQMAVGTAQAIPGLIQAKKDYDSALAAGDQSKADQILWDAKVQATEAASSAYMAYAAAHHGVTGRPEPVGKFISESAKETAQRMAETGVEAAKNVPEVAKAAITGTKEVAGWTADKLGPLIGRTNDFNTAVARAMKITPKQAEAQKQNILGVSEDLQAIANANPNVEGPKEFADKIRESNQTEEAKMQQASGKTRDSKEPVVPRAEQRLRDGLDKLFEDSKGQFSNTDVDKAKQDILDHFLQRDEMDTDEKGNPVYTNRAPNLYEAENIRRGLNDLTRPQYATNAQPTTSAFKFGAMEAAKLVRGMIDEGYHAAGVEGVKEFRSKETKKIAVADALDAAQAKADKMGQGGIWSALTKKYGTPSTVTAIMLGTGHVAAGLGIVPYLIGEKAYQNVVNPNVNVSRALEIAAKNPSAKATTVTEVPTEPAINHKLFAALSSHYGKIVGAVPFDVLENRFMEDIVAATEKGKLSPEQQRLLEKVNDAKSNQRIEIEDQKKRRADEEISQLGGNGGNAEGGNPPNVPVGEERGTRGPQKGLEKLGVGEVTSREVAENKITKKAAIARAKGEPEIEINPHLDSLGRGDESGLVSHTIARKAHAPATEILGLPEGVTSSDAHIHEWAHAAIDAVDGESTGIEIRSDKHPEMGPRAGAAYVSSAAAFKDAAGNIVPEKLEPVLIKWVTMKMAGPASHEVFGGMMKEEATSHPATRNDVRQARAMVRAVYPDWSSSQVEAFIDQKYERARNFLTQPHIADRIKTNAAVREEGLPDTHHASRERVSKFQQDTREAHNDEAIDLGPTRGRIGEGGETIAPSAVEGKEKDAGRDKGGRGQVVRGGDGAGKTARGEVAESEVSKVAPPKERTTGQPKVDEAIKAGGGIPGGVQEGFPYKDRVTGKMKQFPDMAYIHDPQTGTSLNLPLDAVTKEAVAEKIRESRAQYAAAEKP